MLRAFLGRATRAVAYLAAKSAQRRGSGTEARRARVLSQLLQWLPALISATLTVTTGTTCYVLASPNSLAPITFCIIACRVILVIGPGDQHPALASDLVNFVVEKLRLIPPSCFCPPFRAAPSTPSNSFHPTFSFPSRIMFELRSPVAPRTPAAPAFEVARWMPLGCPLPTTTIYHTTHQGSAVGRHLAILLWSYVQTAHWQEVTRCCARLGPLDFIHIPPHGINPHFLSTHSALPSLAAHQPMNLLDTR